MTGAQRVEPVCLIVDCERPAVERGLCAPCAHYYRVILANPYYRDHECPGMLPDGSVQEALEARL